MTEEIKVTCDCKEKAIAKVKEFCFIAGAVFVGVTLSIILCANILKPKCPCPMGMRGQIPRIERHLPPPPMMRHHGDFGHGFRRKHRPYHQSKRIHRDFKRFDGPAQRTDNSPKPSVTQ